MRTISENRKGMLQINFQNENIPILKNNTNNSKCLTCYGVYQKREMPSIIEKVEVAYSEAVKQNKQKVKVLYKKLP